MAISGVPISADHMLRQWRHAVHMLRLNLWNFEAQAGEMAQYTFKTSFIIKRFNSGYAGTGKPWKKHSSSYARHNKNPLMVKHGLLRQSIKWKHAAAQGATTGGAVVYTDDSILRRNLEHPGFSYANIHNDSDKSVRTGSVGNMPQRQFMGHSKILNQRMQRLIPQIFRGIPM